nr:hypothetical protein [Tanacetum cinerariifolium]
MSSASSAVTYTSVYTDSEPGRVFWGADEELSDGGSPRVIVYEYDGFLMQPVAPPSPNYIPGLKEPHTPPVPQDEDEHEPMFIQLHDHDYDEHVLPAEEQPLPLTDSPTAELPRYVTESDPEEDPEEYEDDDTEDGPVDYPMDGVDDEDDDDGDLFGDDADDEDEDEDEEEEEEHLASALIDAVTTTLPSPPLPPPLYIPPPVDRKDDVPKNEMPPRKRLCLSNLGSRYLVGESSTARPTRGRGIDYGFVSTAELLALREHPRRARQPGSDARVPDHQDAPRDTDSYI